MKHDFFDKYSNLNSALHKLEPRAKVISFFFAVLIIASEPRGELIAFSFYYLIISATILTSKIPVLYIFKRCLFASPFIIMAALFFPISAILGGDPTLANTGNSLNISVSILFKAYGAIILLTILTSIEKFHRLLKGLRSLKMPASLGIISALMYRYSFILYDEYLRTTRARESRTAGGLKTSKIKVYGHQMALIFLRSWDRAEIIYKAMLSRGFTGEFPDSSSSKITNTDIVFTIFFISLFITIRVFF